MIISHKWKFIFLRTRKTAGTSIEIALSEFCGDLDIIPPLIDEDERLRSELGFPGPQNDRIPFKKLRKRDRLRRIMGKNVGKFFHHAPATFVRRYIESDVWESYFKFTFERNPYDKAISRYFWSTRQPRPSIAEYLQVAPLHYLSNWTIYTISDHVAVDFVGRYERLKEDLMAITDRIGLPSLELPHAKGGHRTNREHYSKLLDSRSRERIEIVCAKEIRAFGYEWADGS